MISVIIPVYKAEKYLRECILSILEQDYSNFEIILVDDGSPDESPRICDEYAESYSNITVIHKKNEGPGIARNAGMETARGDYILFLDSDDKMDGQDAFTTLIKTAERTGADIVVGCYRRFSEYTVTEVKPHHLHDGEYTQTIDFVYKGFFMYNHLSYNWAKLYKVSFLKENEIKFGSYSIAEDKMMNLLCYVCQPTYAFLDKSVVLYRWNETSLTFQYHKERIEEYRNMMSDFRSFIKSHGINKNYDIIVSLQFLYGIISASRQELSLLGFRSARKRLKKYCGYQDIKSSLDILLKWDRIKNIDDFMRKCIIFGMAVMLRMHLYAIFLLGIKKLLKTENLEE